MKIRFGILCLSLLCLFDCKKNEKEAEKNPKVVVTGPAPLPSSKAWMYKLWSTQPTTAEPVVTLIYSDTLVQGQCLYRMPNTCRFVYW